MLATMTNSGRAAIARAIYRQPIHLAWGSGLAEWDEMEEGDLPSLLDRTALFAELGRRLASVKGFAIPDAQGAIVVPTGLMPDGTVQSARYAQSAEPTPWLYFRVNYDFGDAAGSTIRELGIFMDTEPVAGLPAGQQYFLPGQIRDPGYLLAMQIARPPIARSPSIRQTIEFVMPI